MNNSPRPGSILTINKLDLSAVRACDLLRERESNAAAFGFCGVEGHEEVIGVRDAQAAIFDADHEIRLGDAPSDAHGLGAVRQRCVDSVGEQVDKHLFELIGIGI